MPDSLEPPELLSQGELAQRGALPHPQSRYDYEGKEDEANRTRSLRYLRYWAIDVPDNWDAENKMNPSANSSLSSCAHKLAEKDYTMEEATG